MQIIPGLADQNTNHEVEVSLQTPELGTVESTGPRPCNEGDEEQHTSEPGRSVGSAIQCLERAPGPHRGNHPSEVEAHLDEGHRNSRTPQATPSCQERRQSPTLVHTQIIGTQRPETQGEGSPQRADHDETGLEHDNTWNQSGERITTQTEQMRTKRTKASLKIASLNINGYGSATKERRSSDKWLHLKQIMYDKKIAILMIQEAHLDDAREQDVEKLFENQLTIIKSADPERPRARSGVAYLIDKRQVKREDVGVSRQIIPGRAMSLDINAHEGHPIRLLNVYAPNDRVENKEFWGTLKEHYATHTRDRPNVMGGDFNIVEDKIDRLPMRLTTDSTQALQALDALKSILLLSDGWRRTFPSTKRWTYRQQTEDGSQSRIDRIYVTDRVFQTAREWAILPCHLSDHDIVTTTVVNENSPSIGKGRRSVPRHLLKDGWYTSRITKEARRLEQAIQAITPESRDDNNNIQIMFKTFKDNLLQLAIQREKQTVPTTMLQIKEAEEEMENISNDRDMSMAERIRRTNEVQTRLERLERSRHQRKRKEQAATNRLEGEIIGRYWSQINKARTPRDTIRALRYPDPMGQQQAHVEENTTTRSRAPLLEKDSQKMADMMREFHQKLQQEGSETPMQDPERQKCMDKALDALNTFLTDDQQKEMAEQISKDEVRIAVTEAANWKAPGLDGIPNEIWKHLTKQDTRHRARAQDAGSNSGEPAQPDMLQMLTDLYNDIETHGICDGTGFTDGWMCPLYKKKAKEEMENYRPLTMLNTDYKILTKVLSIRLSKVATTLIHENQAGFIKGRSITDQTKLLECMIDHAELTSTNGAIIALDQEKAYDKIAHDYLWMILKRFRIPDTFISLLQKLYSGATTRVMINGHMSKPYSIRRGVRQGCPLSCLIFDLAIEALAAMLRNSPKLKGYKVPGLTEKLIAILFADDTSVFLQATDKFSDLEDILREWCTASQAKFNLEKTVLIPTGAEEYRETLIRTRSMNADQNRLPDHLHIARDGEASRLLGAWIGNGVDMTGVWTPILEKIDRSLAQWAKSHPTMEGRRLIIQMVVGGMSQYMTQAQEMPKNVERRLDKKIRNYLWGDRLIRNINADTLKSQIARGGRKLLDIEARNEAIKITTLKSYLLQGPTRPTWAYVMDNILARGAVQSTALPQHLRSNIFLQKWEAYKGQKSTPTARRLLTTAKRHNLQLDTTNLPNSVIDNIPAWHLRDAEPAVLRMTYSARGKCLHKKHQLLTIGQIMAEAQKAEGGGHTNDYTCKCTNCTETASEHGCDNPAACYQTATELMRKLPSRWQRQDNHLTPTSPRRPQTLTTPGVDETHIGRTRDIATDSTMPTALVNAFRIFAIGINNRNRPNKMLEQRPKPDDERLIIGTHYGRKRLTPFAGLAVVRKTRNGITSIKKFKLHPLQSENETSTELAAIKTALDMTPLEADIEIVTENKKAFNLLTSSPAGREDNNYLGIPGSGLLRAIVAKARMRPGRSQITIARAQHGRETTIAKNLAKETEPYTVGKLVPTSIHQDWSTTGAVLSNMTQAQAYRHLRAAKDTNSMERRSTTLTVAAALERTEQLNPAIALTPEDLWKAIRHKDLARTTRYFLWMSLHDAYMVGRNWLRGSFSEELQMRSQCVRCQTTETMQHVLFECSHPGQGMIWALTRTIWEEKTMVRLPASWPQQGSLGMIILGHRIYVTKSSDKGKQRGEERLLRIILAEAAHLIWKMRCERVIARQGEPFSDQEVEGKHKKTLEERLLLDVHLTHRRFVRKALPRKTVEATWRGTGIGELLLPKSWSEQSDGVLVGIASTDDDGRTRDK